MLLSLSFCCSLKLRLRTKFEQKPIAFLKLSIYIVQTQRFAFDAVIFPSLTMRTLDSDAVIDCILMHSSC